MNRSGLRFAVIGAALLVVSPALGLEEYPSEVQGHLSLSYAPPCGLCHAKGNTGSGTVTTSFGWAMRGKGLNGDDPKTVAVALDALRDGGADSDGDGTGDIAELTAGSDPNASGAVPFPNGEQPGYGCGGSAPNPNRRQAAFPPIALAALVVARIVARLRKGQPR